MKLTKLEEAVLTYACEYAVKRNDDLSALAKHGGNLPVGEWNRVAKRLVKKGLMYYDSTADDYFAYDPVELVKKRLDNA